MDSDATGSAGPWAHRWLRALAGISIVGTILAALSVFLLAGLYAMLAGEMGGEESTGWYWLVALGFAAAGVAGLLLTSPLPTLAYLLRLVAVLPMLSVGFVSPWLMTPAVVVAAADVSLMLSHWSWTRGVAVRPLAGIATAAFLAVALVPVDTELSCENLGDPPETCDAWYVSTLGFGLYEDDNRNLVGWGLVALLGGLIVAVPVTRDDEDAFA